MTAQSTQDAAMPATLHWQLQFVCMSLDTYSCCREAWGVEGGEGPCWGAGADYERPLHVAVADGGVLPQRQDCHGAAGELNFAWSGDNMASIALALCCWCYATLCVLTFVQAISLDRKV